MQLCGRLWFARQWSITDAHIYVPSTVFSDSSLTLDYDYLPQPTIISTCF